MTKAIHKNLFLLAAVAALTLSSCGREDMDTKPDGQCGDFRFEIKIAPPITRVTTDTEFNSTWEEGDQIGIFAVEHGEPLGSTADSNVFHNVKLTYKNGEWAPDAPLYQPGGNTKLDFYAYHPYDVSATNPTAIAFNVKSDQNQPADGKSGYNRSLLLMAKADNGTAGGYGSGEKVKLAFSYALAMVQVSVEANLSDTYTVQLNGCVTGTVLNLFTQQITLMPASTAEAITMYACPAGTGSGDIFAYRALVPVQEIARGTSLFRFKGAVSGLLVSRPLQDPLLLVAGHAETFKVSGPPANVNGLSAAKMNNRPAPAYFTTLNIE